MHYSESWSGEIFESLPALWEWATWIVDLNRRLQQQEDGKVFTWQKQRVFLLSQITPSTFARTDWDPVVMWLGGAAVHIGLTWERNRNTMYNVQRWERQKRSAQSYFDLSLSSCRKHFCNPRVSIKPTNTITNSMTNTPTKTLTNTMTFSQVEKGRRGRHWAILTSPLTLTPRLLAFPPAICVQAKEGDGSTVHMETKMVLKQLNGIRW